MVLVAGGLVDAVDDSVDGDVVAREVADNDFGQSPSQQYTDEQSWGVAFDWGGVAAEGKGPFLGV